MGSCIVLCKTNIAKIRGTNRIYMGIWLAFKDHACEIYIYINAELERVVSVERWFCSRGVSCVVEYTMGTLRDWSL